jgi:putative hydrolase of the HAD superfamily
LISSAYTDKEASDYSNQAFEVFFEARNDVDFFAGVIESLERLSQTYTLGALTNGNADIEKLGLSRHFSFAFSAADVGSPKPAPDLFAEAIRHTGVEPGEMIYIGDHPLLDMDAAKQFGLHTIWINRALADFSGKLDPDREVSNLAHLPRAVAEIDRD